MLSAEAAGRCSTAIRPAAREQVAKLQALAQEALEELRSLVFELRPPDLERDGLCGALRKHVEVRAADPSSARSSSTIDDELPADPARDREVLRIAQEALQNALKHAGAEPRRGPAARRRRHGSCSRSRTTASASIRPTPGSARAGSG